MLKDALSYTFCSCCAAVQDARQIGWGLPEEMGQAERQVEKAAKKIKDKKEKRDKKKKDEEPPEQSIEMNRE